MLIFGTESQSTQWLTSLLKIICDPLLDAIFTTTTTTTTTAAAATTTTTTYTLFRN